jgi:PII-like signaling protein
MNLPEQSCLLRVFIGESDRFEHRPLHEAIVLAARAAGLAGATVLRSSMGFGASSRLHTTKILRLSVDLPLIIEIVDTEERLHAFLPTLETMVGSGLVTVEPVRVIRYGGPKPPAAGSTASGAGDAGIV